MVISVCSSMSFVLNKTLILRLSSIGDIVLASPLIRVLRAAYPSAQIDFVVKAEFAELLRYSPYLSNLLEVFPEQGFAQLVELKKQIRVAGYDLIVDLHDNFRSRFLRSFVRAKNIVTINKRKTARFLLINFKWNIYDGIVSVTDRYLETLKPFGVENDRKGLELFIPSEFIEQVRKRIENLGIQHQNWIVGLCPGAKHNTKMWLKERFAELGVQFVQQYGASIFIFGGMENRERCEEIRQLIHSKVNPLSVVENFAGEFSLLETAAAMDFCELVVTNDTGLMHLAAARKRKVVTIFGPTVEEFGFFPIGTESMVVQHNALPCRPCTHIGNERCPLSHFRCMKEIQTIDVFNAAEDLLTKSKTIPAVGGAN